MKRPATRTAMLLTLLSFLAVPALIGSPVIGAGAGIACYATGLRFLYGRLGLQAVLAARKR
jgi:hypothetical protein